MKTEFRHSRLVYGCRARCRRGGSGRVGKGLRLSRPYVLACQYEVDLCHIE